MLTLRQRISSGLDKLAFHLDIPPYKYKEAVDRYQSVARYLEGGSNLPGAVRIPEFYCQGSFRLGTMVRPLVNGNEGEYDIDLVCQFDATRDGLTPALVKQSVGDRLKSHKTYNGLLQAEGKRCWTLKYAETDGIGFHLDVLPSVGEEKSQVATVFSTGVPMELAERAIAITHKPIGSATYSWRCSNPDGFAQWFHTNNHRDFIRFADHQRAILFESNRGLYESIADVPDQLVRTPVQRAIQLLKRHRDFRFNGRPDEEFKPISIIITTLVTKAYRGEPDALGVLEGVARELQDFAPLLENRSPLGHRLSSEDFILKGPDGQWSVPNPVNPLENFADRWHEDDDARAKAFFQWLAWVRDDVLLSTKQATLHEGAELLSRGFGDTLVERSFGISNKSSAASVSAPTISISNPTKPWAP